MHIANNYSNAGFAGDESAVEGAGEEGFAESSWSLSCSASKLSFADTVEHEYLLMIEKLSKL